jgi:hypothetical protein
VAGPELFLKAYPRLDMETERFHEDITVGCDDGYTLEYNVIRLKHFATLVQNWKEGVSEVHQ